MAQNNARQLAAADAQASVPTLGSINQQYNQSIQNTRGFTSALIGLLKGVNPASGYNAAVGQEQGIDSAAQARLAALGSPYAAQSAAALGGLGDSAQAHLLTNQGAAAEYGAHQPGIAAARGQLGVNTLQQQRGQAIQQRNQAYAQNFQQALQAARAFGLQKQQFQASVKQANQANAYRYAALAQNQKQFTASQHQQYNEFLQSQAASLAAATKAGGAGAANFTPHELSVMVSGAQTKLDSWTTQGMTIQNAIQRLSQSMPLGVAKQVAALAYAHLTRPVPPNRNAYPDTGTGSAKQALARDRATYQQNLRLYQIELGSFKRYMANAAGRRATQRANTRLSQGNTRQTLNQYP